MPLNVAWLAAIKAPLITETVGIREVGCGHACLGVAVGTDCRKCAAGVDQRNAWIPGCAQRQLIPVERQTAAATVSAGYPQIAVKVQGFVRGRLVHDHRREQRRHAAAEQRVVRARERYRAGAQVGAVVELFVNAPLKVRSPPPPLLNEAVPVFEKSPTRRAGRRGREVHPLVREPAVEPERPGGAGRKGISDIAPAELFVVSPVTVPELKVATPLFVRFPDSVKRPATYVPEFSKLPELTAISSPSYQVPLVNEPVFLKSPV